MYIGYENYSTEVTIKPGDMLKIEIPMEPSAIQLKETRVTAKKRQDKVTEAPASIEIISERDIKRETTTNLGSFLKGLKGVDFTSSGINNYSISVRGFNSSFSTRLLTLTDGRVANIPALRVINYSTIPQSTDDIENIEVVLGPATALYGANAHSGVVNITSKSPANSEGFSFSVSGSNDDRQMQKYNARFAKKLTNNSIKWLPIKPSAPVTKTLFPEIFSFIILCTFKLFSSLFQICRCSNIRPVFMNRKNCHFISIH